MTRRNAHLGYRSLAPAALLILAACGGAPAKPADGAATAAATPAATDTTATAAPAPATPGSGTPGLPEAAALAAREVTTGLSKQTIATPDNLFSGEIEAAAKPEIKKDGEVFLVKISIGTRSPIECDLIPGAVDTAGILSRRMAEAAKTVSVTSAKPTDVATAGNAGVLFAEAAYDVVKAAPAAGEKSDPKAASAPLLKGLVKFAARSGENGSVVCQHNELGYRATFKKIALQVAAAVRAPKVAPAYVQVDMIKMNGAPVGFAELAVTDEKAGTRMLDTRVAMLLPATAKLSGIDEITKIRVDKAGTTLGGAYVKMMDGAQTSDVTLNRVKANEYSVKGKTSAGPVSGTFTAPRELTVEFSRAKAVQKFLAGKEQELKFAEYNLEADAKGAVEVVYAKRGDAVVLTQKKETSTVSFDAAGVEKTMDVKMEAGNFSSERIHTAGTP